MQEVIAGPKDHSRKTIMLMVTLALLTLSLVAVAVTGSLYVAGRDAATSALPVVSVGATVQAPPYQLSIIANASRPLGVAVNAAGDRIYVTESAGSRETKVFDREGKLLGSLAPPDTDSASRNPIYVAVNADGRVYISDRLRRTIDIYSTDGAYEGNLAPPQGEDWSPLGLSFDEEGNLVVTDISKGNHRVLVVNPQGEKVLEFGKEGKGPGELSFPNAALRLNQDRFVVSDSNNWRLAVFDGEGRFQFNVGGGMALPRGLAYDANTGRLYVVDTSNHRIVAYEAQGDRFRQLFTAGSEGVGDGEFEFPNGIALDSNRRLYITDRENNRVGVWGY